MLTRLAILLAVLGQLVSSGLCGAVCGPLSSALFAAPDACCVTPLAAPTEPEPSCCEVEPVEPVWCCDSEAPPADSLPESPEPCPTCAMPCCSAPPPAVPATTSSAHLGAFAYLILAPVPAQWTLERAEFAIRSRPRATESPGIRSCNERLASLCVWVI